MQFHDSLNEAVLRIKDSEKRKAAVVEKLRKKIEGKKTQGSGFLEQEFFQKAKPAILDCKIAGVDSGFVGQELFSTDLLLVRAMGAVFEYEKGKLKGVEYFPESFSFPEPFFSTNALERDEFACNTSIQRIIKEVQAAIQVIEKHSPKYCFIDGSLVPQHADKPRANSKVKKNFDLMLEKVQELYATASKNNCELVGCIEDSRGNRWRSILQESLGIEELEEYHDAVLLNELLAKGERSFVFSYTKKPSEHPILNEFRQEWQDKVFAFYLKPTQFDFPLRVEFLNPEGNAVERVEEIAGIVLAQSSMHREYAFPAVLIEADLRTRLKPEEINLVKDRLLDKLGKNALILRRRDRRPF